MNINNNHFASIERNGNSNSTLNKHTHTGTSQLKNSCQDQGEQKILVEYLNILQFSLPLLLLLLLLLREMKRACVCLSVCILFCHVFNGHTPNYAVGFI